MAIVSQTEEDTGITRYNTQDGRHRKRAICNASTNWTGSFVAGYTEIGQIDHDNLNWSVYMKDTADRNDAAVQTRIDDLRRHLNRMSYELSRVIPTTPVGSYTTVGHPTGPSPAFLLLNE